MSLRHFTDTQARHCDECAADVNHDVEYIVYAHDYAEELTRCRTCGHTDSMTYTGDDI